ncbi:MAG TPA: iron ABC transporter permease [Limnochordales bacterium]
MPIRPGSSPEGLDARASALRRPLPWAAMVVGLTMVSGVALWWGSVPVSWRDVLDALWRGVAGRPLDGTAAIVWQLRLPRVLAGLVTGAVLGLSGAALQGIFRNPLADPYLTGVASGALFGAAVAMAAGQALPQAFTGLTEAGATGYLVSAAAFVGALGAVLTVVVLARTAGGRRTTDLVLAGVVVGSVLTSATAYLMMRDADRVRAVFNWSLGNLATVGWPQLRLALPGAVLGSALLLVAGRPLNAIQLGEDVAASLGLPVGALKTGVIAAASLATASVVAQVGIIGFVGLIVPHILRRLLGGDYRALLPASAVGGALLLVLADLGARVAVRPAELPVGVVTTLLGGPFFLYLLKRGNGHAEP